MKKYYENIINNDEKSCSLNYSICMLMESMWAHEEDPYDGVLDPDLAVWFKEIRTYLILRFPEMYASTLVYISRIGIG